MAHHEGELIKLARRLDEDEAALRSEFKEFLGLTEGTSFAETEPWPEPVEPAQTGARTAGAITRLQSSPSNSASNCARDSRITPSRVRHRLTLQPAEMPVLGMRGSGGNNIGVGGWLVPNNGRPGANGGKGNPRGRDDVTGEWTSVQVMRVLARPPRAVGIPRSLRPDAMARNDVEPAACSSAITGIAAAKILSYNGKYEPANFTIALLCRRRSASG